MDGNSSNDPIFVEDFPQPEGQVPPLRRFKWIGCRLFRDHGQSASSPAALTWADVYDAAPVVVISEKLAREYWKEPAQAIGTAHSQHAEQPVARDRGRGRRRAAGRA